MLAHPLTNCHLEEEERNPDDKQQDHVDEEKTPCAGDLRKGSEDHLASQHVAFVGSSEKDIPYQGPPSGIQA